MSEDLGGWQGDPIAQQASIPYKPTGPGGYRELALGQGGLINRLDPAKLKMYENAGLISRDTSQSSEGGMIDNGWKINMDRLPQMGPGVDAPKGYQYGIYDPTNKEINTRFKPGSVINDPNYGQIGLYSNKPTWYKDPAVRQGLGNGGGWAWLPLAAAYAPSIAAGMGMVVAL